MNNGQFLLLVTVLLGAWAYSVETIARFARTKKYYTTARAIDAAAKTINSCSLIAAAITAAWVVWRLIGRL